MTRVSAPAIAPRPVAPQPAPPNEPAPSAGLHLHFARQCTWGDWFNAGAYLVACRSIFDAETGRYLRPQPRQSPLLRLGENTVWSTGYWGDDEGPATVLLRDPSFRIIRRVALSEAISRAIAIGDDEIVGVGRDSVVRVRFSTSTVERVALSCGDHDTLLALSNRPGAPVACVTHRDGDTMLTREGRPPQEIAGYFDDARIDSRGRIVMAGAVGQGDDRTYRLGWWDANGRALATAERPASIHVVDLLATGEVLATVGERTELISLRAGGMAARPHISIERILDQVEDRRLVLTSDAIELWERHDGALRREQVLAVDAENVNADVVHGAFLGDYVAVHLDDTIRWFAPDPIEALTTPPLFLGKRFTECEEMERDDARGRAYGADRSVPITPIDVAAFVCDDLTVRVSRSDAAELRRDDDDEWARAVMDRYVRNGAERFGQFFRAETGERIVVGHYYVGGCERSHHMVTAIERGDVLEVVRNVSRRVLLPIPTSARTITVEEGAYVGDPSVGLIAP